MQTRAIALAILPALLAGPALAAPAAPARTAAPARRIVPQDTLVLVKLEQALSTRTSRKNQPFRAVVSDEDSSGLPHGTVFVGTVTEASRASKKRPGTLGVTFRKAFLPGGTPLPVKGSLASLEEKDVERSADGRLVSRHSRNRKFDLKWVGYGAGAGLVLSGIFGGDMLEGALLGALGGAAYSYVNKEKARKKSTDVELASGTEFGIRLLGPTAFHPSSRYDYGTVHTASTGAYVPARTTRTRDRARDKDVDTGDDRARTRDRTAARRSPARGAPAIVRVNGRSVLFSDARPVTLDGVLFVPLRDVADEAGLRFERDAASRTFTVRTSSGEARGTVGSVDAELDGRTVRLDHAPALLNDEIYVEASFLRDAAGLRATWDAERGQLDLDTR